MEYLKTIAITAVFVLSWNTIIAQNRWSAEFRPSLDFATDQIEESKLTTGSGFEIALSYKIIKHVNTYIGWGFNTFQPETDLETNFNETGFTFGLQFIHPINEDPNLSYLIRAGGIYAQIKVKNSNGDTVQNTAHGLGYEFGAGLDYVFGNNWSLRPLMGYRALSRDLELSNTKTNIDLNYIVFALGISKIF